MADEPALFPAAEIRSAIGCLADGEDIEPALLAAARAALAGVCPTADRGSRRFVAALDAAALRNVDTEEVIWPTDPAAPPAPGELPLAVIAAPALWAAAEADWLERDPVAWTAFVWRIAVPLARRLGLPSVWQ